MAFLFQTRIFQLVRRGRVFQPAHIAAVFRRDNVGGFRFRDGRKISAFVQLIQYRFGIRLGFGLNHAVAVTLRLCELILMLVVVRLDFRVRRAFLQRSRIQLDVAHAELFRRNKGILVLLVPGVNVSVAHLLFRRQGVNINGRFTYNALLRHQRSQFIRFAFEHEIGANNGIDELLGGQLVTQRLRVLIGRHPHLVDDAVVTRVVEFTVRLEGLRGEDGFFHLLIANAKAEFFGILIQQRFVDKTVQRLLTQGLHIPFVCCQFRELVAQLLLHTVTFTGKSILELAAADLLAIHFCGIVRATANKVTAHAGQYERHDNDTENNLEHETVSSRA